MTRPLTLDDIAALPVGARVSVPVPNDSSGTYEPGLDDCGRPADGVCPFDGRVCAGDCPAWSPCRGDADDPLPWAGPGDMDCRCSMCVAPDLTDGTPDALPAVDACAS